MRKSYIKKLLLSKKENFGEKVFLKKEIALL